VARHPHRPRVLIANGDPLIRLGMLHVLSRRGADVVEAEDGGEAIATQVARLSPDAIVLDLDAGGTPLGDQVRAAAPQAKLILWARDESEMAVFDPGSPRPRRVCTGVPEALLSEVPWWNVADRGE
jgi:DNA-binding NarL/FixJ family response regulator